MDKTREELKVQLSELGRGDGPAAVDVLSDRELPWVLRLRRLVFSLPNHQSDASRFPKNTRWRRHRGWVDGTFSRLPPRKTPSRTENVTDPGSRHAFHVQPSLIGQSEAA